MRIAQLAPLFEAVPPRTYGGTERVVSWLTEALVDMGHEVTLFASNDSKTKARLIPANTKSLRLEKRPTNHISHHYLMLEKAARMAREFDIFHGHLDYLSFPFLRPTNLASIHTLHGRLDLPELVPIFEEYSDIPLVSISDSQRRPLPDVRWQSTVYHGLPRDLYSIQKNPSNDYLVLLGRICPDKGIDTAIEIAHKAGLKLIIAGKVDSVDELYYQSYILPLIEKHDVEFVGEADDQQKSVLLGNARAMLFPINWPEPFGLVMIESMACGTPVIAFNHGSVSEIIRNGENGLVCSTVEEAVAAVNNIDLVQRNDCRRSYEERFTSARMAEDYVRVYETTLAERCGKRTLYFASASNLIVAKREQERAL